MKIIITVIFLSCFALVLVGCNETVSTPPQRQAPAVTEAPVSTPSTTTESKPTSEADSKQIEPPDETSLVQITTPESDRNTNTDCEPIEPVLLDELKRNCQITQGSGNFNQTGLAVGEIAVNFTLRDINGSEFRLSQFLAEKPVMMIFGSFT